jgi:hypothetical protein
LQLNQDTSVASCWTSYMNIDCDAQNQERTQKKKIHACEKKQLEYITDKYLGPKHINVTMSER